MSIRLEQLEHRYAGTGQGLLGVSLEVERGELLAVIGASGCGKSTMLRLVAGLLPVQSGRLLIDDRDVAAVPPWGRSVGMVFQSYALFPHLSVLDNVAYGLRMRGVAAGERRRAAQAMIASVGLSGFESRRPSQLSGGQQQRVALARAFAPRPALLLADEPTGSLDAATGERIIDLMFELNREAGSTLVLVTHDESLAARCGVRLRLHAGKLESVERGAAA